MATLDPMVTIGIPTYNRCHLLARSIESALRQTYQNIEVVVSDNASTDDTSRVCNRYATQDGRLKYTRLSTNRGATANFSEVLKHASGEYFLWLGDDDWLDEGYVRGCVDELHNQPAVAIVYGTPLYYYSGKFTNRGTIVVIDKQSWWKRVIDYFSKVVDNGMFYGIMRTRDIRSLQLTNTMGGDWFFIANLLCSGTSKHVSELHIHRELGGASVAPESIAKSLQLPRLQQKFHVLSIAIGAFRDIAFHGTGYQGKPFVGRVLLASTVLVIILTRHFKIYFDAATRSLFAILSRQRMEK